jgi:hypothetical protein
VVLSSARWLLRPLVPATEPNPPEFSRRSRTNPDAFAYQITNLNNVTDTYHYAWQNTGTLARFTRIPVPRVQRRSS